MSISLDAEQRTALDEEPTNYAVAVREGYTFLQGKERLNWVKRPGKTALVFYEQFFAGMVAEGTEFQNKIELNTETSFAAMEQCNF